MSRKDEIIYATLELASEYGLKAVSMSQIADKVGIKKPSLYNHFRSKDEIMNEMYLFLREQARSRKSSLSPGDPAMLKNCSLGEILTGFMEGYMKFISDENMLKFFKVIYSERATSPAAAQIMLDETERMTAGVRNLFYALVVHGKMKNDNADIAALSYALTVHGIIDRQMDMVTAGKAEMSSIGAVPDEIKEYIKWFCRHMEAASE